VLYLAGNVHFSAKSYDKAIRVFKQITDTIRMQKLQTSKQNACKKLYFK
jgi:hypothetical protein